MYPVCVQLRLTLLTACAVVQHGYSTRTTNKGRRPAFAVGLAKHFKADIAKHFKADIASQAKAKKASEDAARAQKKAEQDTAEATLDLQRDAVAVLERQRAEDDAEEACYFSTSASQAHAARRMF